MPHRSVSIIVLLLMCISGPLSGQGIEHNVRKTRIDLAVPDNPAFNILGGSASGILRPGSLREVSVLLGDMLFSNPANPGATSFEVAPMLLVGTPTLSEYSARRQLYSARLSFATTAVNDGARQLSFGFRIALIDETDLRVNKNLLDALRGIGDKVNLMQSECLLANFDEWMALDATVREKCIEECVYGKLDAIDLDEEIREARERVKRESWNKTILEIGAAGAAGSSGSLVEDLSASAYSFWSTWAQPVFGTHGQLLLGVRGSTLRAADNIFNQNEAGVALRCYVGKNNFKGFLEFDFLARSDITPMSGGALGIELNLYNGIWIDGSAGLERAGNAPARITGGFNLRLATPEVELWEILRE